MGEAKRNLEEVRAQMMRVAEGWMLEPTDWEARMVEEVRQLPRRKVKRLPPDMLAYMRMQPGDCHANTYFMEREDPENLHKRVIGWMIADGQLVLHSVVERLGEMVCVTPGPRGDEDSFLFIPDSAILCEEIEGRFVHSRGGERIKFGLRVNPATTIAFSNLLLERLRSGMNPYKAMEVAPPHIPF